MQTPGKRLPLQWLEWMICLLQANTPVPRGALPTPWSLIRCSPLAALTQILPPGVWQWGLSLFLAQPSSLRFCWSCMRWGSLCLCVRFASPASSIYFTLPATESQHRDSGEPRRVGGLGEVLESRLLPSCSSDVIHRQSPHLSVRTAQLPNLFAVDLTRAVIRHQSFLDCFFCSIIVVTVNCCSNNTPINNTHLLGLPWWPRS